VPEAPGAGVRASALRLPRLFIRCPIRCQRGAAVPVPRSPRRDRTVGGTGRRRPSTCDLEVGGSARSAPEWDRSSGRSIPSRLSTPLRRTGAAPPRSSACRPPPPAALQPRRSEQVTTEALFNGGNSTQLDRQRGPVELDQRSDHSTNGRIRGGSRTVRSPALSRPRPTLPLRLAAFAAHRRWAVVGS